MVQIPKKQQFLRETAVFEPLHRIDADLREKTPFEKFKESLAEQYV